MANVAIVFQSGRGRTKIVAEAILKGVNLVQGVRGNIFESEGRTYMRGAL